MVLQYQPIFSFFCSCTILLIQFSWGPIRPGSGGHLNEAPGPLAQAAIEDVCTDLSRDFFFLRINLFKAIKNGRGGLGSIYVWAAGA